MSYSARTRGGKSWSIEWMSVWTAALSVLIASASLIISLNKDTSADLKSSTRDWQKGLVFSILLAANKPLSIEEIEQSYNTKASAFRDKYRLVDKNFSREEVYSVLLDLISSQSLKIRDVNSFALKTDDDTLLDRRIVFDMLQFVLDHESRYSYDEFAAQFASAYSKDRNTVMTKDHALAVLSIAIQSNVIGIGVKPGTRITCIGGTLPLYVASVFSLRSAAPALLQMPAVLPPCPEASVAPR